MTRRANSSSSLGPSGVITFFDYDALGRQTTKIANDPTARTVNDTFNTKDTVNWLWTPQQTVPFVDSGNNVIKNVGTGTDYNANVARTNYTLTDGKAMQVRLKVDSTTTSAHIMVESSDGLSRIGVIADNGTLYVQQRVNGGSFTYPKTLISALAINTWYVVTILLDDAGGFTVRTRLDAGGAATRYTGALPAGKTWRFHHWVYRNTAYLDDYQEFSGATFRYDAGTYGKGHRTSMTNASAATTWQYDARGRKTNEQTTINTRSYAFQWAYDAADRVTALTYPSGEVVSSTYDAAWRETSACTSLGGCYVQNPQDTTATVLTERQYTAQGQPQKWTFGNTLTQRWTYNALTQRPDRIQLNGTTALFDRSYTYDAVGNVTTIPRNLGTEVERFSYDALDRLTHAWTTGSTAQVPGYDESFTFSPIGNLLTKGPTGAPKTYIYPASGASSVRPHAVTSIGVPTSYTYDATGNMLTGGGRTYTWNADNQPLTISVAGGASETYTYNAEGSRVSRTTGGTTTLFAGGLVDENLATGTTTSSYAFGGKVVAQRARTSTTNVLTYLHTDHLGGTAVTTSSSGAVLSRQDYTPWGEVRTGTGIPASQTTLNFTGQRKDGSGVSGDGTGLLFYNARYYDPALGRFSSADSIVPDAANGSSGKAVLTTDFHEVSAVAGLNKQNGIIQVAGFWFQLDNKTRQDAESPAGPSTPQALNRYSYVQNNPLRYTDPSGHAWFTAQEANTLLHSINDVIRATFDFDSGNITAANYISMVTSIVSMIPAVGPVAAFMAGVLSLVTSLFSTFRGDELHDELGKIMDAMIFSE